MKHFLTLIVGSWCGRGMAHDYRCYRCGAPCRTSGGFNCPIHYNRAACTNWLCDNWIPF
jgi:hypothetical protein